VVLRENIVSGILTRGGRKTNISTGVCRETGLEEVREKTSRTFCRGGNWRRIVMFNRILRKCRWRVHTVASLHSSKVTFSLFNVCRVRFGGLGNY
jgi:hypothetical protein